MIWSSGACFVVDRHLKIEHWNDAMALFMGLAPQQTLHQPCFDVFRARSVTGLNFCQALCPLIQSHDTEHLEQPLIVVVPTQFTGQQLVQVHFALWENPLTIVHWIHPVNRDFIPPNPLTPRQHQIFSLLSQGMTRIDIAHALNIALSTVNTHIRRVCDMWDVPTERQALTYFIRMQSGGKGPPNDDPDSSTT
ncbi:MAG: LuxR C-terminal-related transcriptional regulator [Firmicutes bacterium]|jgi:DNA-binding CsgD family transcriptional regulator|uniref:HTH luxR-type domain-containing protein n=1 Tax=Sulfobacillus benefaciens TaxID=453960 RepID=A0A2T2X8R7_9FIRM|nr:LuxR C-terminal-related transcriptional regulator [Bacillota bacterium]PSR30904.1 MAG: hypothetical protein C7B43_04425 [Sulfobacillus benefaciens]HBQ94261.1 hypothetical protein [Sulfobacillus sp.]